MRGLKVCLWIVGLACVLSVCGLVMPISLMDRLASAFGAAPLPDSAAFEYLVRAMSATFVGIGVFYIILALRPEAYGPMVPFSGVAGVFVGVVCGITGLAVGVPSMWYLGDASSCIVLGVLILVFWGRARRGMSHAMG